MALEDYHNLAYWADDPNMGNEDPPDPADEERRIRMASDKDIDARLASLPNIRYPESGRMPAAATTPDESVVDFQRRIRGMLVGGDEYEFAEDTLRGILKTVTESNRVTLGQINAVDNIAANPHRVNTRRFR